MKLAGNARVTDENGKLDEFNRLTDAETLPLLMNARGFRQDLTVWSNNNGLSISVWDDRDGR